jgi:hypothetical protein
MSATPARATPTPSVKEISFSVSIPVDAARRMGKSAARRRHRALE